MKTNKILAVSLVAALAVTTSISSYAMGQGGGQFQNSSIERPENWMMTTP